MLISRLVELFLTSIKFDSIATEGKLTAEGVPGWYTLELPYTNGLPGSAIPPGRFEIIFAASPKFLLNQDPWVQEYARRMPHVVGIPGRSLIMIHWGNDVHETEGCILVGKTQGVDFIGHSREAFQEVFNLLWSNKEQHFLNVERKSLEGAGSQQAS